MVVGHTRCVRRTAGLTGEIVSSGRTLDHGGRSRTYTAVHAAQKRPDAALVIVAHGAFGNGKSMRRFTNRAFDRFTGGGAAVVVYPDAVRREWNGARAATMLFKSAKTVDDIGFLRALVDDCVARDGIDRDRVYLAGFSLGGQLAIRALHDAPEILAAVAVFSATLPGPGNLVVDTAGPVVAVPVLTVHGTADPLTPYHGGDVGFRGQFSKGPHLSAPATAAYFARRNAITGDPVVDHLSPGSPTDPGQVTRTCYWQDRQPPVTLYTVVGGEHEIPGASTPPWWRLRRSPTVFDAVAATAQFFGLPYPTDIAAR